MAIKTKAAQVKLLPVEELRPSDVQPRSQFADDKILELAQSITCYGILQPLIVKKNKDHYEIVAGERRYRAARIAKLKQIPCIIMNLLHENALAIALVENIQREDLNPIEEALAYFRLQDTLKLNQEEIAKRVGKDRATVANTLRLLRLPKLVQDMVSNESITMGHARALLALDSLDMITMLAKKTIREELSVRRVEALVRAIKGGYQTDEFKRLLDTPSLRDPIEKEIQKKLERVLGTRVNLRKENTGFSVTIHLSSPEQLNSLLESLGIEI